MFLPMQNMIMYSLLRMEDDYAYIAPARWHAVHSNGIDMYAGRWAKFGTNHFPLIVFHLHQQISDTAVINLVVV